mgnify:CR=1 FL=1
MQSSWPRRLLKDHAKDNLLTIVAVRPPVNSSRRVYAPRKVYKGNFLLKQGFYNYTFVTLDEVGEVNLSELNGTFYQTENEYTVLVYYKPFGEFYQRVIGVGTGFFDQNR